MRGWRLPTFSLGAGWLWGPCGTRVRGVPSMGWQHPWVGAGSRAWLGLWGRCQAGDSLWGWIQTRCPQMLPF